MDHLSSSLKISCAQLSDAGLKDINEDSIGIRVPDGKTLLHKGIVAVIADGVSSAEAGREASQACVQNLLYDYYCTPDTWTVEKSVGTVLKALNRWLYSQGSQFTSDDKGYITTLSILILKNTTAHIFHVGDSRIYRARNKTWEQLTQDHSRKVSESTYLSRAMGLDKKIEIDYRKENIKKDDLFFLSTDGVHDFSKTENWDAIIEHNQNLELACKKIQSHALKQGSNDNLSCQIIKVAELDDVNIQEIYTQLSRLPFPPLLKVGQSIDGLTVISSIYESTRSQLYLVEEELSGKRFVMKTPSPNFSDDAAYIERFINESWLGKRFRHNKLVKIIERQQSASCLYYLMEYIEGVSLDKWIDQNAPCSTEQAMRIVRQIALALRYLHRQQVIHQDLKPGNIIIDDNEQVKLVDFGSCYLQSKHELPNNLKQNEVALGTANYSAPECHLQKKIDERCDQFSLAVILYELLSAKAPYGKQLEKLSKESELHKLNYQTLRKSKTYIPQWFDLTLAKALKPEPSQRFGDIDEFLYRLENGHELTSQEERLALMAHDPLKFWKSLALVEALLIFALLALLL